MSVRILDLTPGDRGIWFDKNHPSTSFGLRPYDRGFGLIVFDPPHVNVGASSKMTKNYGHSTTEQIRDFIKTTGEVAYKVSESDALMAFKWNDHDQPLLKILALMSPWWEPLFGQRTATRSLRLNSTYWVMLRRRDAPLFAEAAAE
jgi:hypothetical protein